VLKEASIDRSDEPELIRLFRRWLEHHRGVAESTLYKYCRAATVVIEALGNDPGGYSAKGLRSFILERSRCSGPGATKTLISGARAFLRYLSAMGLCRAGLDQAIPAVAEWRLTALPCCLGVDEVSRIIDSCDTETVMGARDHAIIWSRSEMPAPTHATPMRSASDCCSSLQLRGSRWLPRACRSSKSTRRW
jgi:site-specific recombinase XerD